MTKENKNNKIIDMELTIGVVSERIDGLLFELGILLTHVEIMLVLLLRCAGSH